MMSIALEPTGNKLKGPNKELLGYKSKVISSMIQTAEIFGNTWLSTNGGAHPCAPPTASTPKSTQPYINATVRQNPQPVPGINREIT